MESTHKLVWLIGVVALFSTEVSSAISSPAEVRILQTRSSGSELDLSVKALGKTLNLEVRKVSAPAIQVERLEMINGSIEVLPADNEEVDFMYESKDGKTSLYLNENDEFEGIVDDSFSLSSEDGQLRASNLNDGSDTAVCGNEDSLPENRNENQIRNNLQSRALSYNVDILALVDSKISARLRTVSNLVRYIRNYYGRVNSLFNTVQGGNINIRLRSIRYSSSASVDNSFLDTAGSRTRARMDTSANKFARYVAKYRSVFDIAHMTTGRDFYLIKNGVVNTAYTGRVVTIGGACQASSSFAWNSGVAEDRTAYGGVETTAHEIAHNLGAWHDGSGTATRCSWSWGYIMSYVDKYDAFSSCSSRDMLAMYYKVSCLRN